MYDNYFELLADPSSTIPCYFIDTDSQEILYMNQPLKQLSPLKDVADQGKFLRDIISDTCGTSYTESPLTPDTFVENHGFSEILQSHLCFYRTPLTYQGRHVEMIRFFETDSHYIPLAQLSFPIAMAKFVEILSIRDRQQQIQSLLALLGEYYQCDRSYFYIMKSRSEGVKELFFWETDTAPKELKVYHAHNHEQAFFSWVSTGTHLQVLDLTMNQDFFANLSPEDVSIYQENNYHDLSACPSFLPNGTLKSVLGLLNKGRKTEDYDLSLLRIVGQFIDISEKIHHASYNEGQLQYVDHLTGALNREKYNQTLQFLKFEKAKDVGVVFINVNGLKKTNQYYGLEAGDKLIRDSMDVASSTFSQPWYRLSGDEFVCFVTDNSEEKFKATLSDLHHQLATMPQRLFALGSAWGNNTNDIDKLMETADTMMFIDKQTYYTDFDPTKMEFSDHVLQDLLLAVQEEEFLVYLQPKIELATETVIGAEALIRRFSKKQNKMIFPDQFIPLYEKKSIIRHVDLFVLRKICILLQSWNGLGKKLKVSVNLSRVTLLEHGIVHKFAEICDDYNISHDQIVVEVTERVGLIENEVESPLIEQFKNYGFIISLDDFGCAYSNIVTLATISVDEVKIDKSLVDNILTNPKNKSIVENMIRMVDSFGDTLTLAEGVETKEQADCLRDCHCKYAQGYYYSRPIPVDEFFEKYVK